MLRATDYPYARWPRLTRSAVRELRAAARLVTLDASTAEAARALLGSSVTLELGMPEPFDRAAVDRWLTPAQVVAVVIAAPWSATSCVVVELDRRIARVVVDCALGGQGDPREVELPMHFEDIELGVVAFIASRIARGGLVVRDVVSDGARVAALLGEATGTVWPVTVRIAGTEGAARVWLPAALLDDATPRVPAASRAVHLARLTACLTVGRATLTRAEAGSLRVHDVVVLDEGAALRLEVLGAPRLSWRCVEDGDALRVEPSLDRETAPPAPLVLQPKEDPPMNHRTEPIEPLELARDAPIELVVELARFPLSLGELGALRPGEVVRVGKRIGERVVLRSGEHAVAVGELVDVEGEVGVRILELGA